MSNVKLINAHEQPLVLPAGGIEAIIHMTGESGEARPTALSTFRGFSVHPLGQPAAEVLDRIKAHAPEPRKWIALTADDGEEGALHCLLEERLRSYDVVPRSKADDTTAILVWFETPAKRQTAAGLENEIMSVAAENTPENLAALDAVLFPTTKPKGKTNGQQARKPARR